MKSLSKVLTVVILIALAVYALLYCRLAVSLIAYPFDWEESDGNVILVGKLLEQGRPFYCDPNEYPMLPYVYPPAHAFVVFAATRLLGDYVGIARLVSFISTGVICILIYRIVRREGVGPARGKAIRGSLEPAGAGPTPLADQGAKAPRSIALMAALMMFPFAAGMRWMASAKPDAFFTMLLLIGFWGLSRGSGRTTSAAWLVLAWLSFLAAIFTKQAGLPAAALGAFYLIAANWRRGLPYTILLFAASAALAIAIQHWSRGWFYNDVYRFAADFAANVGLDFRRFARYRSDLLASLPIPLSAALITVFFAIRRREHSAWVLLFAGGMIWSLQVLRNGIDLNHTIPCVVAVCILFGIGASRWCEWAARSGSSAAKWGRPGIAVLLLVQLAASLLEVGRYQPPDRHNLDAMQRVCNWGRAAKGPVMIDYMPSVANTLGRCEYAVDSCNLMFCMTANEDQILDDVRARRFAQIILFGHTFLRRDIMAEIFRRYRIAEVIKVRTSEKIREVAIFVLP